MFHNHIGDDFEGMVKVVASSFWIAKIIVLLDPH